MEWIERRLLPSPYVCLALTEEGFHKAMEACNVPEDQRGDFITRGKNATTHVLQRGDGDMACVVCLAGYEERTPIEVAGLLVHEAVHVWQTLRDDIMSELKPGWECEAYSIQFISQRLMESFVDQTQGIT